MNTHLTSHTRLAAILAAGLAFEALAQDPAHGGCSLPPPESVPPPVHGPHAWTPPDPTPPQQRVGDIRYVTGGIGIDAAEAMRRLRGEYPMSFTFALGDGGRNQFVSGVFVRISQRGTPLLELVTEGPYLHVDLPPGAYHITASSNLGPVQERDFSIREGRHTDLLILWTRQP